LKFWDSSALVALAFPEPSSGTAARIADEDEMIAIWWGTPVELESAAQRAARNARIAPLSVRRARQILDDLEDRAAEIGPTEEVRERARRMVRVHELRAADALQLAAALVWSAGRPEGEAFVSLDRRLRTAADLEGFSVLPVELPPAG
jgi:predicted nucleic acid-binding protein